MKLKRVLSLGFGISGIILTIFSLTTFQTITGAVVGVNSTSKYLGSVGILLMIVAVVIERYELGSKKKIK